MQAFMNLDMQSGSLNACICIEILITIKKKHAFNEAWIALIAWNAFTSDE